MLKAIHRLRAYIKHDLREIINPSSLPNPPDHVPQRASTWAEKVRAFKAANKQYSGSWRAKEPQVAPAEETGTSDSTLREELSITARAAVRKGQGLRPLLHQIYETRARSYQDAVQQFVQGYKEGYVGRDTSQKTTDTTTDSHTTKPEGK